MNKKYLLIMRSEFGNFKTELFYTLKEAEFTTKTENKQDGLTTIIDLENENNKGQGCE